jgi:hypothetical protein
MEISRYTFHVNSAQRNSGSITDLNINLSQIISLKSKKGMFKIIVHDLIFPFSFYQLSSEYNTLSCTFTDTAAHTKTATLTITSGNYTVVSILTALSTALTTICQTSSGSFIGFTPTFNFTYNTTTCKSTLQMTAPASASIVLPFQNNLIMGGFFGMSTSQTISTISTPVSTKIAVANPVNQLLLRSGNLKQFQNREWYIQKDTFADILFRMPVSTQQGTWLNSYHDSDPVYIVNRDITTMNFYVTSNLSYTALDTQGIDWNFSFSLVEEERPEYIPISDSLLVNREREGSTNQLEERAKLESQLEEELSKLAKYKKKILGTDINGKELF